jgi:hypothetical protein
MGLHVVPLSRRGLSARLTTLVVTFVLALSAYGTSVASAATPYQTAVLGSTPSSYLRLGELAGATTARNEVVGALDGGYLGSFHFADKGAEVGELAPSLQGGYVSVPDGAATGPTGDMAVEFWMKPNSISTTVPIVEKYGRTVATGGANNSLDGYQLRLNVGGTVTATLYGSAGATVAATSTQPLEAGRWAHIVAADDGTALRLYVNGVATATTLVTFATTRSPNPLATAPRRDPRRARRTTGSGGGSTKWRSTTEHCPPRR